MMYVSKDLKALDTLDFWVGTFLIFVLATVQVILFGWVLGVEKGWAEAHKGAEISIPRVFKFIIKYVSPAYLLVIFGMFILRNVYGWDPTTGEFNPASYIVDLTGGKDGEPSQAARMAVGLIATVILFLMLLVAGARELWTRQLDENRKEAP